MMKNWAMGKPGKKAKRLCVQVIILHHATIATGASVVGEHKYKSA